MEYKNKTIRLRIVETVEHRAEVTVTDDLLAEAEAAGYERSVYGVADMLDQDADHEVVLDAVEDDANFSGVMERYAYTEVI